MKRVQVPQAIPAGFAMLGHHRLGVKGDEYLDRRCLDSHPLVRLSTHRLGSWADHKVYGPSQRRIRVNGVVQLEGHATRGDILPQAGAFLHEVCQYPLAEEIAMLGGAGMIEILSEIGGKRLICPYVALFHSQKGVYS